MTDLTDIEHVVLAMLQDSNNYFFTDAEVDAALRTALAEYSQVQPYETETVVTLTAAGREIALSSLADLTGITGVLDVWWPFSSTTEVWPPNKVTGFRTWLDAGVLTLFLNTRYASQPKVGDKVRLWWTKANAINTLDGATATTLTAEGKAIVALGAAGYTAASGAMDRAEVLDREAIRLWGEATLKEYQNQLEIIRSKTVRTSGEPWGAGWIMDKWDNPNSEDKFK